MALLSPSTVFLAVLIAVVLWRRWRTNAENPGRLPVPPGPAPLPILGNIRDLPLGVPQYELYEAMAQKYGEYQPLSPRREPICTHVLTYLPHARRHHTLERPRKIHHRLILARGNQRSSREAVGHLLEQTEVYHDA